MPGISPPSGRSSAGVARPAAFRQAAKSCGSPANSDQHGRHPRPEGDQQRHAQPQPADCTRREEDQPDRIPAGDEPARDAESDNACQATAAFGETDIVVLAQAGEVAPQPPDADGRDEEPRPRASGQGGHQRSVLSSSAPESEPRRSRRIHAPGVGQRGRNRKNCPLNPATPLAHNRRGDERLPVTWLDCVRRPKAQGDQGQGRQRKPG